MADNTNNNQQNSAAPSAPAKQSLFKRPAVRSVSGIVLAILVLGGAIVYKTVTSSVAIDDSLISAPVIAIGPQASGILQQVYVKPGDTVTAGENIAAVGTEVLTSKIDGLVIATQNVPGQVFAPGSAVVSMIDPQALRVLGTLDENKGLSKIKIGDPVYFTVDAFGSQKFTAIVDEISPTANDTSVVFNISDQRATQEFDVKARYDVSAHPEFKNGMSAKMKVFPQ